MKKKKKDIFVRVLIGKNKLLIMLYIKKNIIKTKK